MNYRSEVVKYSAILEQKGFLTGLEGNVSVCDRENDVIYITPSMCMKTFLTEDMIAGVRNGEQISGTEKRSSEFLLHEAVYKAMPKIGAVVHSHCPYLTAYALRYEDFYAPENTSLFDVFPHFTCLPYGKYGTHEIHQGIENALRDAHLCLLGGHGVVAVADTLEHACSYLMAAEGFAKTIYIAENQKTHP